MAVGLSTGTLALLDCSKCEVIRQESLGNDPIKAIAFSHKQLHKVFVACGKSTLNCEISPSIKTTGTWTTKKHQASLLAVSPNDT